jgi:RNA polymerase sigma-70 factor (ECF subfamily)
LDVNETESKDARFPVTRWTWVSEARGDDAGRRLAALEAFLHLYYPALLRHVTRQFQLANADAEDCLQDFLLDKVIRQGLLARADRERGRFRTFLCQALNHFVIYRQRREQARKRAPAHDTVPIETIPERELNDQLSGQEEFDRVFFLETVQETLRRMRERCHETDRAVLWELFERRVLERSWKQGQPVPYDKLVPLLGLDSASQAANLLTTAKRMFVRTLRSVLRDYTGGDPDLAVELQELRRRLQGNVPSDS